jgi:hypothetical protein
MVDMKAVRLQLGYKQSVSVKSFLGNQSFGDKEVFETATFPNHFWFLRVIYLISQY